MDTENRVDEIKKPENGSPAEDSMPKKIKNNKRRKLIQKIVIIAVVVLLAIGIPIYIHEISYESSDDAFIDGHIIVISPRVSSHVSKVLVDENQRVKAGDLLVELDPRDFQARLDAANADLEAANAAYHSNNIHVALTSITTTADVDEAKASVNLAKAEVQTATAGVDAAKSQTDLARAQLDYAKSTLAQAVSDLGAATVKHNLKKADLTRALQMAETISKQQLDHATAAEQVSAAALSAANKKVDAQKAMVAQARAAFQASKDALRQAKTKLSAALSQLDQANARYSAAKAAPKRVEQSKSQAQVSKADISKAAAAVEQAQLNLSYTKIYAPTDGYVTKKYVEPGMYVQTGQALMSIVQPDVWVTANFKETQLTHMRPGQPAVISVDAYPDVEFKGHVDSIQHGTGARFSLLPPENATGNYVKVVQRVPVKIVFDHRGDEEKYLLAPGMSVVPEVNIKAKGKPASSKIPAPSKKSTPNASTGHKSEMKGSKDDARK